MLHKKNKWPSVMLMFVSFMPITINIWTVKSTLRVNILSSWECYYQSVTFKNYSSNYKLKIAS